ncbi:MAG: hypothetical protein OXS28_19290 [Gammaproteobacteria bacterium]|nr:hypothetical protein [Gammaproteobacteria bacterium]
MPALALVAAAVTAPLPALDDLRQDTWLIDSGVHPCDVRQPPCSDFVEQIFDRIIEARARRDDIALRHWEGQLYRWYLSSPEDWRTSQ